LTRFPPTRITDAAFVAGAAEPRQFPPPSLAEVCFAGRSNVGKSSLMNRLLDRKNLVRTSSTPGLTRIVAFFSARAQDGAELLLVDLPGYGYARRSKEERLRWAELAESYLLSRPTLTAVVLVVDARRGVEGSDLDLLRLAAEPPRVERRPLQTIIVATKLDKLPSSERKTALVGIERSIGRRVLGVSARTGEGRDELWELVRRALARQGTPP
jgi:GTP-binding protein